MTTRVTFFSAPRCKSIVVKAADWLANAFVLQAQVLDLTRACQDTRLYTGRMRCPQCRVEARRGCTRYN